MHKKRTHTCTHMNKNGSEHTLPHTRTIMEANTHMNKNGSEHALAQT